MAQIVRLPMARPRIVRTKEEAAAVPLNLPVQVELRTDQVEFRTDPVLETELFLMENELALAEQLVAAKKRVVKLLREAVIRVKS
jgi:hypothetical protein